MWTKDLLKKIWKRQKLDLTWTWKNVQVEKLLYWILPSIQAAFFADNIIDIALLCHLKTWDPGLSEKLHCLIIYTRKWSKPYSRSCVRSFTTNPNPFLATFSPFKILLLKFCSLNFSRRTFLVMNLWLIEVQYYMAAFAFVLSGFLWYKNLCVTRSG